LIHSLSSRDCGSLAAEGWTAHAGRALGPWAYSNERST
jgi:hypothetical protein